jgi:hypothetical protein
MARLNEKHNTEVHSLETDTLTMGFSVGGHVQCVMGDLKGMVGVVAATRTGGRLLVRIAQGVLIEVPQICLRNDHSNA